MAKSLSFTDTSMKIEILSVNGPLEKWRLRQNGQKQPFVRKTGFRRFEPGFTDKRSKKPDLSVNPHHNGQKFTDKSLKNACLSVKCVLLTDKSSKIGAFSVNLNDILFRQIEQHCIL